MKKKKIFISIYYMEIGGAERSLISLLNNFDYNQYEVDLFVHNHTGELMSYIPDDVNLLPQNNKYATFGIAIKEILKKKLFCLTMMRLLAKFKIWYNKLKGLNKNISNFLYLTEFTSFCLPSLKKLGTYDLAISFIAPHNIVLEKVSAKKKIAWIHTDYSTVNMDTKKEYNIWSKYDNIISISEEVTKAFLQKFPLLKNKIIEIENINSPIFILNQANQFDISNEVSSEKGIVTFCSVGRFSEAKNFVNAVEICKYLVDIGVDLRWYLIGYGSQEEKIRQAIIKHKMDKYFIILGKKNNPYPYMKKCDFYIQPSIYEGKAISVKEAQILLKPVIITNYPTSQSQVKNNIDGIIIPLDNEKAAVSIYKFLLDKQKQDSIINNLKSMNFDNRDEIMKLYNLID